MMKTMIARCATAAAGTALALVLMSGAAQAEWRGWNIHPPEYPVSIGMEKFAELAKEKTKGRVTGKVYHSAVLGDQSDAISQVQLGAIDFAEFNMGPIGTAVPEVNVVSLPFIFRSVDHMHRVMDGPVGDKLAAAMEQKGLVALAWYDSGARSFYNTKKPITSPNDMKGMKMRVMNNTLFVGMVESMGGNATPMPYSDVYQSLKTGVIDGAENNWPSYESSNHYEVAGYYSLTEHLILPECLCVSKVSWSRLSADDQKAVREAARESATLQRQLWADREAKSRAMIEKAGGKINEITNKVPFQTQMVAVYEDAIKKTPALKDLIADIKAVQ